MSGRPPLERPAPGGADPFRRPLRNQALRRSRRRQAVRRSAWGLALLALGLAAAGSAGVAGWRWLRSTPLLAVEDVLLEGLSRADPAALRARVAPWRGRNLLAVDLERVRRAVAADPWVEAASVRRNLPDALAIRIAERQPVAVAVLDGALTLVDGRAEPIARWQAGMEDLDLPLLTGLDAWESGLRPGQLEAGLDALERLQDLHPGLPENLSEIDLSRGDGLTVRLLDEPAPLVLSREDVTINLEHYFAVREDIHGRMAAVAAIDLRWRGRVVVIPASHG
jgi:cell division protein FtsQ